MRKQIHNEFRLKLWLSIAQDSRLLIAEDREKEKENNHPDQKTVTCGVKSNGEFYLPGSSIKGVLRNRAEFIANILSDGLGVCHPFDKISDTKPFCGERFKIRDQAGLLTIAQRYVEACPACQLFGHTFEAGRLRVTDFILCKEEKYPFKRSSQPHAPIDRMSGGVNSTNLPGMRKIYTIEYLTQATFYGEVILENFSIWQIGWLGFLLQDLQDGLIQIGHKQTTGAGKMNITNAVALARMLGIQPPANKFKGLIIKLNENHQEYFLGEEEILVPNLSWNRKSIWWQTEFADQEALNPLWAATRSKANDHLTGFRFSEAMSTPTLIMLMEKNPQVEVNA